MEEGEDAVASEKTDKSERADLLMDRFRLSVIAIAEAEAKKQGMEIAKPVVICIADLAFKFTEVLVTSYLPAIKPDHDEASWMESRKKWHTNKLVFKGEVDNGVLPYSQLLGKDVELFAQHAGRKSVNMEDVVLSAHRNEHLHGLLRSFSHELKGKESTAIKKRRRSSVK